MKKNNENVWADCQAAKQNYRLSGLKQYDINYTNFYCYADRYCFHHQPLSAQMKAPGNLTNYFPCKTIRNFHFSLKTLKSHWNRFHLDIKVKVCLLSANKFFFGNFYFLTFCFLLRFMFANFRCYFYFRTKQYVRCKIVIVKNRSFELTLLTVHFSNFQAWWIV